MEIVNIGPITMTFVYCNFSELSMHNTHFYHKVSVIYSDPYARIID